jgi:hypothetical protein
MSESKPSAAALDARPKTLAALLGASSEIGRLWRPEELAAIFRHQLSAPVLLDLGGYNPATAANVRLLSDAQGLLLKSFSELFQHPTPPLELLELTKNFAKANMNSAECAIPGEVATALYYLSIASALVRLGARITTLEEADLKRGLLWAKSQVWVDDVTRKLLEEALVATEPPGGGTK